MVPVVEGSASHGCGGRHELWLRYALKISVGRTLGGRSGNESRTTFWCCMARCHDLEFLDVYEVVLLHDFRRSLPASLPRLLPRPPSIRKRHALLNFDRFHFDHAFLYCCLLLLFQPSQLLLSRNPSLFAGGGSIRTLVAFLVSECGSLKLLLLHSLGHLLLPLMQLLRLSP